MGRALVHRCMAIMAAEGVTRVTCRTMTRSTPMRRLLMSFGAVTLRVNALFPSISLDNRL